MYETVAQSAIRNPRLGGSGACPLALFYVMGNALNVNNTLTMNNHHKVIVWENGVLNLDDATIDNAKVIVKDGGLMNVSNDGEIHLGDSKALRVDMGGTIHISSGKIF